MKTAPAGIAPAVQDKIDRYTIERCEKQSVVARGQYRRLAVRFTEKSKPFAEHWLMITDLHTDHPCFSYIGPPWKQGHRQLYFEAALALFRAGVLPELDWKAESEADTYVPPGPVRGEFTSPMPISVLPLPPTGPPCPECGQAMKYECAHVGGRGTCWRHVCFADGNDCGYFEKWRN